MERRGMDVGMMVLVNKMSGRHENGALCTAWKEGEGKVGERGVLILGLEVSSLVHVLKSKSIHTCQSHDFLSFSNFHNSIT